MSVTFSTASEFQRKILHCTNPGFADTLCWPVAGRGGAEQRQSVFSSSQKLPELQNIMRKVRSACLGAWEAGERRLGTQVLIKSGLVIFIFSLKKLLEASQAIHFLQVVRHFLVS